MDRRELELLILEALNRFFAHDACLLDTDVSEWSVAHRFAVYLEQLLPGWNIDCEYNRQGEGVVPKAVATGTRVRPDIIVHHRGQLAREYNLLAIELKKIDSGSDFGKACEYTAPPDGRRKFQYRYGLTVVIGGSSSMTWFENGQAVS